jgi:two-component system cell cycle response regulator
MRVLVVDDDLTTALAVRHALTRFGYDVETATNGAEAWNLLQAEDIPIVVTDLEMPVEDGVALCKRIRATDLGHYTYVILLTDHSERETLRTAWSSGVDDFVSKPLDAERLRVRLIVAQRIVALERELRERNSQLVRANAGLEVRSRVDALTGAGNRAAFQDQIETTHARAVRGGRPYGVVVCDFDKFKQINDVGGHQFGDRVLTGTTDAIRNVVRRGDVVFRYGGDEIVLIIPDEGLENVVSLAERVRAAVCLVEFNDADSRLIRLTASFGVATYPETSGEGADWAEVFSHADEAMYVIKRQGGNGVQSATVRRGVDPAVPVDVSALPEAVIAA